MMRYLSFQLDRHNRFVLSHVWKQMYWFNKRGPSKASRRSKLDMVQYYSNIFSINTLYLDDCFNFGPRDYYASIYNGLHRITRRISGDMEDYMIIES